MARPERNNVDYFPHPTRHGKKMNFIRKKYGNDGYSTWFIILEHLGDSDNHYLNLSDEVGLMYLSSDLNIEEETLISIVNDLVKLGEFDKELWENERIIYSEKFIASISDAYKKRNNDPIDRDLLITLLHSKSELKKIKVPPKPDKSNPKDPNNPQRKEEDSKEEETIEIPESEGEHIDSIPPDNGKPKPLKFPSSDSEENPDQKEADELALKATQTIAEFFNISEQLNAKSYFEISRFVQHFSNTGKIDLLRSQFKAYRELKELDGCKHSWKNFIGSPASKYEDGTWCEKTWAKELIEYKSKQSKFSGNGAKETPIVLQARRTNRNPV